MRKHETHLVEQTWRHARQSLLEHVWHCCRLRSNVLPLQTRFIQSTGNIVTRLCTMQKDIGHVCLALNLPFKVDGKTHYLLVDNETLRFLGKFGSETMAWRKACQQFQQWPCPNSMMQYKTTLQDSESIHDARRHWSYLPVVEFAIQRERKSHFFWEDQHTAVCSETLARLSTGQQIQRKHTISLRFLCGRTHTHKAGGRDGVTQESTGMSVMTTTQQQPTKPPLKVH